MNPWNRRLSLTCLLLPILLPGMAAAKESAGKPPDEARPRAIRIAKDSGGKPVALETAIIRFAPRDASQKDGPTVDLIGAVHVGEKSYYEHLNKEFKDYDVVLYELIAPKGSRIPKGGAGRSQSPISMIQKGMKDVLRLEFQLEAIDYTAENLVHADMSPDEFANSMKDRGESVFAIFLRMMGHAMAKQQTGSGGDLNEFEVILALLDKSRSHRLKQILAEQFEDMEGSLLAIEGPDGSTLIAERNKVALGILKEQISGGKKKIAIFYGAGHLPDFQKRLRDDFALEPTDTRWLPAWDLKAPEKPAKKR